MLLACARTRIGLAQRSEIQALAGGEIGWEYLAEKAERHGIAPLLYRNLVAACPGAVPGPVMDRLQRRFRANARRSIRLDRELVAVLQSLNAAGVEAIALKGPTLAHLAYGEEPLREFADLDILVRPRDVAKAGRALLSRGYNPDIDLAGPQLSLALRSTKEQGFDREDGDRVELHWRLTPPQMPPLMDFDSLWERRTEVNILGHAVPAPRPEDLLLYLIVHGGKHAWSSLNWLVDVARLMEEEKEIEWNVLMERARAMRSLRMLRLGLILSVDLLGAPAPPELVGEALRDPVAAASAREISRRAFGRADVGEEPLDTYRWQASLSESARDRLRCWWNVFCVPQLADWQALPLPRPVFFLYYALRPCRLLGRQLLRALRIRS